MKLKLLLVEDDKKFLTEMEIYLSGDYQILTAETLDRARSILRECTPDAAVLDLMLPDGNGIDLLKERLLDCPTVILTTMDADDCEVDSFDAGAKDFLVKPVSMRILAKHLSVRLQPRSAGLLTSGNLMIDTSRRTVIYGGAPVSLTSTEFNILVYLFTDSDEFRTAEEIYAAVYGDLFLQSTAIKVHLSNLRNKLNAAAPGENYVQTSYGKGYRFRKESNA